MGVCTIANNLVLNHGVAAGHGASKVRKHVYIPANLTAWHCGFTVEVAGMSPVTAALY
jgi:hypothetical protein